VVEEVKEVAEIQEEVLNDGDPFRIEGARLTQDEKIEFYVSTFGKRDYVSSKEVHKDFPQKVIDFYESRLIFETKANEKSEKEQRKERKELKKSKKKSSK